MSNTYTQIHIQVVFAVKFRKAVIEKSWNDRLHRYIIAIVQKKGHKVLAINTMPDHLHLFFGMRPTQSLSDLMEKVKKDSSMWINAEHFTPATFRWQEGYSAFSYSKDAISNVVRYIENQEEHHRKKTFIEEHEELLIEFGIEYDKRYIFQPLI
jgi:REP element-mobilizing transposase RayT